MNIPAKIRVLDHRMIPGPIKAVLAGLAGSALERVITEFII